MALMLQPTKRRSEEETDPFLPEELMIEILKRLPARLLTQLKLVCKSWNALIKTPFMVSNHYSFHKKNPTFSVFGTSPETAADSYSLSSELTLNFITRPSPRSFEGVNPVGPWKGIYYLENKGHTSFCDCGDDCDDFVYGSSALWNPTTGELKHLPDSEVNHPKYKAKFNYTGLGFGVAARTNDLKVLRNVRIFVSPTHITTQIELYSFQTNSYTLVKDHPSRCFNSKRRVSVLSGVQNMRNINLNGACHWLACMDNNPQELLIVAFDWDLEVFSVMQLPAFDTTVSRTAVEFLAKVNGKISCLSKGGDVFTLWTMNEYGIHDSWTKLWKLRCPCPYSDSYVPTGLWKEKLFFVFNSCQPVMLHYCDPSSDQRKTFLTSRWCYRICWVFQYEESLFSVEDFYRPQALFQD